jgi:magnesium/cobalt transport protein CorA
MEIVYVPESMRPERLEAIDSQPDAGLLWLDFARETDPDWARQVEHLTGVAIHEGHVSDSFNTGHPSFYDATSDYEMIVFRSLAPDDEPGQFASRASAFFIIGRVLVSVRARDSRSIDLVRQRLLKHQGRVPGRPISLLHQILSTMVDGFLAMREALAWQLDQWRRDLFDPKHPFGDWLALIDYRRRLLALALLCEGQEDAVVQLQENTDAEIDDHLAVRLADLKEHIRRVGRFAVEQQSEVESIVQLHFSAMSHRTNEIVRVLTVVSAIFLPLTLIAGIFGMNFDYMPELHYRYAYYILLGIMVTLVAGLLVVFRIKRWI